MKIYVKIGTEKRFDVFKRIVLRYDVGWYNDEKFTESFDSIKHLNDEPVAMCINTETPHLEYARLNYYKSMPEYINIKLSDLKQFLSEAL